MKYKFYITDTFDGQVVGTNDEQKANEFSQTEDFFVVDSEKGLWLTPEGKIEVKEL